MRRVHLFIDHDWHNRLKKDMKKHGFNTISSFVRYIIIKFFDKNHKKQ